MVGLSGGTELVKAEAVTEDAQPARKRKISAELLRQGSDTQVHTYTHTRTRHTHPRKRKISAELLRQGKYFCVGTTEIILSSHLIKNVGQKLLGSDL